MSLKNQNKIFLKEPVEIMGCWNTTRDEQKYIKMHFKISKN